MGTALFPPLDLRDWHATRDTLHGCAKLLGQVRATMTPKQKHWWHITLHVGARGFTTTPIPAGELTYELFLNLVDHELQVNPSRGEPWVTSLRGRSIADLRDELFSTLTRMGVEPSIDQAQFADHSIREYDGGAVDRYWQALTQVDVLFKRFRGTLRDETSPVQLFPHHFDLSFSWFSGRKVPGAGPDDEESADEQMAFGFSTGDETIPNPYIYVTAYPLPHQLKDTAIPEGGYWHTEGFEGAVLEYDTLTKSAAPQDALTNFLSGLQIAGASLMND